MSSRQEKFNQKKKKMRNAIGGNEGSSVRTESSKEKKKKRKQERLKQAEKNCEKAWSGLSSLSPEVAQV